MKLSVKVLYGIKAVFELAQRFGAEKVRIAEVSKKQKIPIRYLEQLLLILKRKGLVNSIRGKEGGYLLKKHPADISILEIIEAFEGPIDLVGKSAKDLPVVLDLLNQAQNDFKKKLSDTTIEDLVFKKKQKERTYTYNI